MKESKFTHKTLVRISFISLAVSLLSAFTTIIGYKNSKGVYHSFSVFDFISPGGNGFDRFVGNEYVGHVYWNIDISIIRIFVFLGIAAFICAIIGLVRISEQKENQSSFLLAVIGLIFTMAPSVVLLICTVALRGEYLGSIRCGIYPVVCPISMAICIYTTSEMHRKNLIYKKKLKEANGLIFKAGNL